MLRGGIYLYDFGLESKNKNSIKPVAILQNDVINRNSPTTIAFVISVEKKTNLPSQIFIKNKYGLDIPSVIHIDQPMVINQASLKNKIGEIESRNLQFEIYQALLKVFGLQNIIPAKENDNLMCLCGRCLNSYFWDEQMIVKRADYFQKYKDRCFKCDGFGFDYIITRRNGGLQNR